jgi:hypothetical protein
MDELFSILNLSEIKRQAAKIAAVSDKIKSIILYLTDIPIADNKNTYPHYVFVITLNINEKDLNAMFASYLTDEEIDTLVAKTPFFELPAKFTEIMENINPPPPDIGKMLEIAEEFRDSWTSANPSSACQNITRFYKPGIQVNYAWDMIILASDSKLPANMRADSDGMIQCYPSGEDQAPAAEAVAPKENSLDISAKEPLIPASANEVVFSYVSPTEVMVKCGNKRAASYKQIDLGFKKEKKPKAWNAFLDLLKSGKSSIDFGKSGTTDNDNTRKIYKFINDKLVDFLRSKLKMPLPHDVKLFERDKAAATGIYKINFRIGKYNTNSIGVEDLPDDKLMAEIKKCLTEQEKLNRVHRGDKAAETQSEEIRERIIPLLMEAQSRKLIDDKAMKSYMNALNPPEHD